MRSVATLAMLACVLGPGWSWAQETTTYTYDALGRLTLVVRSGGPANNVVSRYGYDNAGNRTAFNTANDTPVAVNDSVITEKGTAVTFDPRSNDSDPFGQSLSITAVGAPANGSRTFTSTSVTYTPNPGFTGTDPFSYTISNANGITASATITVTVAAPPVANPVNISTPSGTAVSINPVNSDTDAQGFTLTLTGLGAPLHGTASQSGNVVTYTPAWNWVGPDSFTYTISDGHGGTATNTINATVTVRNPTANPDYVTTEAPVSFNPVSNDTDPQGFALTLTGLGTPLHGTASYSGNTVTYTPAGGYTGPDSITYSISDGHGGTATGTINITVNLGPTANADSYTFTTVPYVMDVLANDRSPEGYALTIIGVTQPPMGEYVSISNNKLNFGGGTTVAPDVDSFTYTISDGHGGTSTGTVQFRWNCSGPCL